MDILSQFLPSVAIGGLAVLALVVVHRYVLRAHLEPHGRRFRNQSVMLALTALALLAVVLSLPISDTLRGQVLSLLGILLSASIALASTTLVANGMAGLMVRSIRSYRVGDFITTGEHFGRVTEVGLFHTEIQTQDRDITTLPNLYLVNNPVKTILGSGTIVSATVSLGYDVGRSQIEERLLEAAAACGLKDAFVQITDLGDFAVTYRLAGFLAEVKTLLTTRSNLRAAMMDALHGAGIEIVSPRFHNNRNLPVDRTFIPPTLTPATAENRKEAPNAESIIFDKADEAASLESLRTRFDALVQRMAEMQKRAKEADPERRERMETELATLKSRKAQLEAIITAREARADQAKRS